MLEAIFLLALNIYHEADVKDELVCRVGSIMGNVDTSNLMDCSKLSRIGPIGRFNPWLYYAGQ